MDRRVIVVFAILIALVLAGEILTAAHPASEYNSSFSSTEDGFSYSFGKGSAAEYNLVLTDNGDCDPVQKLYLYCDKSYGYSRSFYDIDLYTTYLKNRLHDRGFDNCEIIDTAKLTKVVSEQSVGVGILICSGAIPEELIGGKLLDWVKSGGTLYWTWGVIGQFASKSDGTIYALDESLEKSYLGSFCTNGSNSYASAIDDANPYSHALGIQNNWMWNSVDTSKVSGEFISLGYKEGTNSEITFIGNGDGEVCVISGATSRSQMNDVAQLVCSGLTVYSKCIYTDHREISAGQLFANEIQFTKEKGHRYVAYTFLTGINSPYGRTVVVTT